MSQFQAHLPVGEFSFRMELVADCCKNSVGPLRESGRMKLSFVCVERLEESSCFDELCQLCRSLSKPR